jgi:peptidoglycan hydrolase CwlO-like protein
MRRRTLIAAVAIAGALVVSGAALAGTTPPSEPTPACERAQQRLEDLQARAGELAGEIAALEQQLAGGNLTAKQEKKARQRLANLQERLGNVEERIDKAEARVAARCGEEPTDPPDEPPGPTE